jgi:hypothetical protein
MGVTIYIAMRARINKEEVDDAKGGAEIGYIKGKVQFG